MELIPAKNEPERYLETNFKNSKFIKVISNELIIVDMRYPALGMKNAEVQCFVREEVYDMLVNAAKKLPKGYKLKIWDAWRPFSLQSELFDEYSVDIIAEFQLEECSEDKKRAVIQKFISAPIEDRDVPPVHTTGGAVDVTLTDDKGNELEMGSCFDTFTDKAYTNFYENEENNQARDNRRLLYSVMTKVGFTNLPSEWWHYDYGDRFWAYYNGTPAIYMGVFTKEEMYVKS